MLKKMNKNKAVMNKVNPAKSKKINKHVKNYLKMMNKIYKKRRKMSRVKRIAQMKMIVKNKLSKMKIEK